MRFVQPSPGYLVLLLHTLLVIMALYSFGNERTRWSLFQKRIVHSRTIGQDRTRRVLFKIGFKNLETFNQTIDWVQWVLMAGFPGAFCVSVYHTEGH